MRVGTCDQCGQVIDRDTHVCLAPKNGFVGLLRETEKTLVRKRQKPVKEFSGVVSVPNGMGAPEATIPAVRCDFTARHKTVSIEVPRRLSVEDAIRWAENEIREIWGRQ